MNDIVVLTVVFIHHPVDERVGAAGDECQYLSKGVPVENINTSGAAIWLAAAAPPTAPHADHLVDMIWSLTGYERYYHSKNRQSHASAGRFWCTTASTDVAAVGAAMRTAYTMT